MFKSTVEIVKRFILAQCQKRTDRPLLVALQGPQGSGKSYTAAEVQRELAACSTPLRTVVISIDDLYLPHSGLSALAKTHSYNALLQGRGQPGTHDVDLGIRILSSLKTAQTPVRIPQFDKSLHNGEGDRLPEEDSLVVEQPPPIDVVILEGWCVGFRSIPDAEIDEKWHLWEAERRKLRIPEGLCRKEDIAEINALLKHYDPLWDMFDTNVQLALPPPDAQCKSRYSTIYSWRLEQEHHMKALNGGKGMADDAVRAFVDRYIPGYVFFASVHHSTNASPHPSGSALIVILDMSRNVVGVAQG